MIKDRAIHKVYEEVLLVDDDPIDLFINEKILQAYGFANTINKCTHGEDALELIRKRYEKGQALPSFIFLDFIMPGLDGAEFVTRFKNLASEFSADIITPIVVLTAMRSPDKKRHLAEDPNILAVVNKPLTERILVEIDQKAEEKLKK